MTSQEFQHSLKDEMPLAGLQPLLQALWWDAKGDWKKAHEIAQEVESSDAAWVHAYLHRKEGDASNAGYWYRRAGKRLCEKNLKAEWLEISGHLVRLS